MIERINRERVRTPINLGGPSRTKQSFKDATDVNLIVRNHAQTHLWDHLNPQTPMYGDFSGENDLHAAYQLVDQAQDSFDELPARVRSLVDNDPVKLLHALAVQEELDHLVEAGLPMDDTYKSPAQRADDAREGPEQPEPIEPPPET